MGFWNLKHFYLGLALIAVVAGIGGSATMMQSGFLWLALGFCFLGFMGQSYFGYLIYQSLWKEGEQDPIFGWLTPLAVAFIVTVAITYTATTELLNTPRTAPSNLDLPAEKEP